MKSKLAGILLVSAVSAQAEEHAAKMQNLSTEDAIKIAPSPTSHELINCVKNWRSYSERRSKFHEIVAQGRREDGPIIALQIGNSGFGRYDFIVVNGSSTNSSFPKLHARSSKELIDLYDRLRVDESTDLADPGSPSQDDGDCYFLMIKDGGEVRNVAIYGTPGATKVGLLIKKMLELVR
jgi:hypothetical protein